MRKLNFKLNYFQTDFYLSSEVTRTVLFVEFSFRRCKRPNKNRSEKPSKLRKFVCVRASPSENI